jgi:hypothetical protein
MAQRRDLGIAMALPGQRSRRDGPQSRPADWTWKEVQDETDGEIF